MTTWPVVTTLEMRAATPQWKHTPSRIPKIIFPETVDLRPHVHIIEDEDSVRESLLALLDACGWEASGYATATGFLSALSDESSSRPRCLIVDIQLPDMSGLDLLSELFRREEMIPSIVITGHGEDKLRVMAAERNAVGYFQKPFNSAELLNAVSGVLSQAT